MSTHATGTLEMKSWAEHTWDGKPHNEVSGHKLTQGTMVDGYQGDLEGTGELRFVMTYADDQNCESVGHELITGTLGGRTGTFVLQHVGGYHDGTADSGFTVVPGSGTGELAGLSGSGSVDWSEGQTGRYALDYDVSTA